jgi:hypothetical protein
MISMLRGRGRSSEGLKGGREYAVSLVFVAPV